MELSQSILPKILNLYGIEEFDLILKTKGYRNDNYIISQPKSQRKINLIIYKNDFDILQKINAAHAFAEAISKEIKIDIRHPLSKIGTITLNNKNIRYFCIYNYIEGDTLPWEKFSARKIRRMGKLMASINILPADADYKMKLLKSNLTNRLTSEINLMTHYLKQSGVQKALNKKLNIKINPSLVSKIFLGISKLLSNQSLLRTVVHLDFVRSNIIFKSNSSEIVGIIDAEKATIGPRIFDIARTLAFLLTDISTISNADVIENFLGKGYLRALRHLPKGYKFSKLEKRAMPILVNYYLLFDFYKFLQHNPYENLTSNYHFVNTLKQLNSSGIVQSYATLD